MSAWIVSKAHIDALITSALKVDRFNSLVNYETADKIGAMLWKENHKSVNYRYNEAKEAPAYRFTRRAQPLSAVEALKAIDCLEYQSCEHKGWEKSEAKRFLDKLRGLLIHALPGYDAAPWGIDS